MPKKLERFVTLPKQTAYRTETRALADQKEKPVARNVYESAD